MPVRGFATYAVAWALVAAVGSVAGPLAAQTTDGRDAETAIRRLLARHTKSVDEANTDLASTVWASTPDVSSFIRSATSMAGDAIKKFYAQTMGQTFSERRLTIEQIAIHSDGDTARAEFCWGMPVTRERRGF